MKNFLKIYKRSIIIILIIVNILNIAALSIFDIPLKNEICPNGIVSFELAKDINQSVNIINSWDENAKINIGLSLGIDFLFLILYSSLIAFLIYNIENRTLSKYGKILIYLIFFAAFLDAFENIALIKLLLGDIKQIWASIAYYFAAIKFAIIFICIVYIVVNWGLLLFKKQSAN